MQQNDTEMQQNRDFKPLVIVFPDCAFKYVWREEGRAPSKKYSSTGKNRKK